MDSDELRRLQAPVKDLYRDDASEAQLTLTAQGKLDAEGVVCSMQTHAGPLDAGLHPAAGGDGSFACSGNMLLEALVGCAGVTLLAVSTALKIPIRGGRVVADGDMDFRGTLGMSKEVPVGFSDIRLRFELDTDADDDQLATLLRLTERYCVVYQTLKQPPEIGVSVTD